MMHRIYNKRLTSVEICTGEPPNGIMQWGRKSSTITTMYFKTDEARQEFYRTVVKAAEDPGSPIQILSDSPLKNDPHDRGFGLRLLYPESTRAVFRLAEDEGLLTEAQRQELNKDLHKAMDAAEPPYYARRESDEDAPFRHTTKHNERRQSGHQKHR